MPELGKSVLPITKAKAAINLRTVAGSIPRTQPKETLDDPLYPVHGNEVNIVIREQGKTVRRMTIRFWMHTLLGSGLINLMVHE
jgi:hypothetical protein